MIKIKLGDKVKDKISGFTGIATGKADYLAGCIRIQISPQTLDKDGKPGGEEWFDEDLVETVKENGEKKRPASGGPMSAPTTRQDDMR